MSLTGRPGAPAKVGISIADIAAGCHACGRHPRSAAAPRPHRRGAAGRRVPVRCAGGVDGLPALLHAPRRAPHRFGWAPRTRRSPRTAPSTAADGQPRHDRGAERARVGAPVRGRARRRGRARPTTAVPRRTRGGSSTVPSSTPVLAAGFARHPAEVLTGRLDRPRHRMGPADRAGRPRRPPRTRRRRSLAAGPERPRVSCVPCARPACQAAGFARAGRCPPSVSTPRPFSPSSTTPGATARRRAR